MISHIIIILYALVSIVGVFALTRENTSKGIQFNNPQKISLSFFTLSHLCFLSLGIANFFISISVALFIVAIFLMIASRITNGITLYGRNNWTHHAVTITIFLSIIILQIYKH